jgi:hypothetical protein
VLKELVRVCRAASCGCLPGSAILNLPALAATKALQQQEQQQQQNGFDWQ